MIAALACHSCAPLDMCMTPLNPVQIPNQDQANNWRCSHMLLQGNTEDPAPTRPSASEISASAHPTAKVAERELPKRVRRPSAKAASGDPFGVAEHAERPAHSPKKRAPRSRACDRRAGANEDATTATSGSEEEQEQGEGAAPPSPEPASSNKRKVMPAAHCVALTTMQQCRVQVAGTCPVMRSSINRVPHG
jgi:hypothetical protein